MQTITHDGISAFNPDSYTVYRDFTDPKYGAKGDGVTDDSDAINLAISDGSRCGNQTCQSSTLTPALVYFPNRIYLIKKPIILYYYTAIVGDALNRPTLRASSDFSGIAVIDADVYTGVTTGPWNCPSSDHEWYCPVNNFFKLSSVLFFGPHLAQDFPYSSVRNFIIDTTAMPPDAFGTGIHWQVGQDGSGGFMADLSFNGGAFGMWISNQQFTIHNVVITNADTAVYVLWNWVFTFKNIQITGCRVGFGLTTGGLTEATQTAGSIVVLDSSISATLAAVQTTTDQSTSLGGSIVLQNVDLSGSPVGVLDGASHNLLSGGGTVNQFVLGNVYSGAETSGKYSTVAAPGVDLPSALLDASSGNNGVFFRTRPQYENYAPSEFVSAKANGVVCDGKTDASGPLQSFINKFWGCKILCTVFYMLILINLTRSLDLDAGTCLVTQTIKVPTGSTIFGEFWTTILASGTAFSNAGSPTAVLQVGEAGDTGAVEISDIVISTTAGSAGAIGVEWNVKGDPGKVGMWDVHVRIGGAVGTGIQVSECPAGATSTSCQGAFLGLHVAATGSGYFENIWVWSADHDLDDNPGQGQINSFSARGIFIDNAVGPVWLVATAAEHHTLYQYSIVGSNNVYAGMIQTETPYYQPVPAVPGPFQSSSDWDDPDWSHSGSAWALNIATSNSVFIYGAGLYSFFDNYSQACKTSVSCQKSLALVDTTSAAVFIYSLSTIGATTMLTVGSTDAVNHADNVDGLQSTLSKWSSTVTTPPPPPTPIGCPALQTPVLAAMDRLMNVAGPYWYDRDCERTGICGHFPDSFTSPGLSATEWTNVNTFETIYNGMWQTDTTKYQLLVEEQAVVPNKDHGSSNVLPVTGSFTSQDAACGPCGFCTTSLMYIKVQQYNDNHGLSSGSTYYYDQAVNIQQGIQKTWLSSSGCGGGVPQKTSGTAPNTITTHLYFALTVALALYEPSDPDMVSTAHTVANWYLTGKGTTLRDKDGLWFDGQSSTCDAPDGHKYTYNQGVILSALGWMNALTGDNQYITFALVTLDGVVNSSGSTPLPQPDGPGPFLEVVNGVLAEWCDGAASSTCDGDQQYFKGAFMKHLQYFLDNVDDTVKEEYAGFVGQQAAAVVARTTSSGDIGNEWYAPDAGGSIVNYNLTMTAGLDALNCAQKYGTPAKCFP
ncbi:pectate lyase superfamily protein-domain-containing protein [Mycena galopus ATCC 62051]|nr:pectate lyase superfamily protein-domain-containing protein [Mycena galopus ATCC 62051]